MENNADTLRRQRDELLQALREVRTLRLQRDELLQALREVRDWSGSKPDWLHDMIDELLVKYDAVTGVTPTQEDSDE